MMFRRMFVFAARLKESLQVKTWPDQDATKENLPGDSVDEIFLNII